MPQLLVYDDGRGQWGPLTDLRAAFDLRSGAQTTLERIQRALGSPGADLWVRQPDLAPLVTEQYGRAVNQLNGKPLLCVNGRWPGIRCSEQIRALKVGMALVQSDGQVIGAHLESATARNFLERGELPDGMTAQRVDENLLMDRPWHLLDQLETTLPADLAASGLPCLEDGGRGAVCFGRHPVQVAPDAQLQPQVVFNSEHGAIVVESGALIGALAVLEGPCYIGRDSQVVCHAHIRPHTVIGPVCKAAGEISFSIMQGFSNKAHHGYLGHSLVGQWVNLGAATSVSNVKNTYGRVRVQLEADEEAQDTGRQFCGLIIGDHVRTAIGTRLMTGGCVGTGAMIATPQFPPKCVRRFCFFTADGAAPCQIDRLISTCRRMMSRRGAELSVQCEQRLREMAAKERRFYSAA